MERRALRFESFNGVLADVRQLRQSGHRPLGNWNLGQICEHLARVIEVSLDGSSIKLPWLLRRVVGPVVYRMGRWFGKGKMKAGIRIPPEFCPSSTIDESQAIEHLGQVISRFETHTGLYQEHPFFGRLSGDQWREYHLVHCAHHLGFLLPAGEPQVRS